MGIHFYLSLLILFYSMLKTFLTTKNGLTLYYQNFWKKTSFMLIYSCNYCPFKNPPLGTFNCKMLRCLLIQIAANTRLLFEYHHPTIKISLLIEFSISTIFACSLSHNINLDINFIIWFGIAYWRNQTIILLKMHPHWANIIIDNKILFLVYSHPI